MQENLVNINITYITGPWNYWILLSDLNLYVESYFSNKVGDTGNDKERSI